MVPFHNFIMIYSFLHKTICKIIVENRINRWKSKNRKLHFCPCMLYCRKSFWMKRAQPKFNEIFRVFTIIYFLQWEYTFSHWNRTLLAAYALRLHWTGGIETKIVKAYPGADLAYGSALPSAIDVTRSEIPDQNPSENSNAKAMENTH